MPLLKNFAPLTLSQVPHNAQHAVSGERTPLLGSVVPIFEMLIAQWDALIKLVPRCAPFLDAGLACARTYYDRMGNTRAYIIAMRKLVIWFNGNMAYFDICSCEPKYPAHVDQATLE